MTTIIGLLLIGLIFIAFEVVVPGAILGILGGLALLGASVVAYSQYGSGWGTIVFLGSIILLGMLLFFELVILPKTKLGRKFLLKAAVNAKSTNVLGDDKIIGREGETATELAPSGKILVDGVIYEGFSQEGLIRKGEKIKVVNRDNFRIIVVI
ncbi:MAG: NfeD family protein, partial [Candidatus Paceibacterales bacterium]